MVLRAFRWVRWAAQIDSTNLFRGEVRPLGSGGKKRTTRLVPHLRLSDRQSMPDARVVSIGQGASVKSAVRYLHDDIPTFRAMLRPQPVPCCGIRRPLTEAI